MTGVFWLDWATLTISLFNTMILVWLGLTVLLNTERRGFSVWLTSAGLLLGAAFFISHTTILGQGLNPYAPGLDFWWRAGWAPVVLAPFAWYLVVLWYAGFWEDPTAGLNRRQRPWLAVTLAITLLLMALLALANPLPSFTQVAQLNLSAALSIAGLPVLILFYPFYIVLCILLALDALLRPGPTARLMGQMARRRARPWLLASTFTLLTVSLLVSAALAWIAFQARSHPPISEIYAQLAQTLAWFDLTIAGLISLAVLLVGQAIVAYEIFTGKPLPRRQLRRAWYNAVILSGGSSAVVAASFTLGLNAIYGLLLALLLVAVFYALLTWRAFTERDQAMRQLRPFVASQRLYDQFLSPSALPGDAADFQNAFDALVNNVLGARSGALVALGPLAPLAGAPLFSPPAAADLPDVNEILGWQPAPTTLILPLDPARSAGYGWATPLWNEHGLIGLLFLAEKTDGSFYTQEEMIVARASGERLLDLRASAEMARRLVDLQRQRLSSSQMQDLRARRRLHDEVLPQLHTALLWLSADPAAAQALPLLTSAHRQISDLLREMPAPVSGEISRMGLLPALRQVVENELPGAFDAVEWDCAPQTDEAAQRVPPANAEVLFFAAREALRNAAAHARAPRNAHRPLRLMVRARVAAALTLEIEDDGVGLSAAASSSGSGQGLALHSTLMAVAGGSLSLDSQPGRFTRVTLSMPLPAG